MAQFDNDGSTSSNGYGEDRFDDVFSEAKRIKLSASNQEQVSKLFNPSEKSSPLGLSLKKTQSFLDLIETKVFQIRKTNLENDFEEPRSKKTDNVIVPQQPEKLKAANFPAKLLRIGSWERVSKHEGDLVAKCYYAKRKLVWEVLDCGLKSKIEVQWADISAIRAEFPENGPEVLEIELSNTPAFSRETNPQPRKHTQWAPATDFTGGQAPIYRRHFLQFEAGVLQKHYEKLLQCDERLYTLNQQPFSTMNSHYFRNNRYHQSSSDFNVHQPQFSPRMQMHYPHFDHFDMQRPSFAPFLPAHRLYQRSPYPPQVEKFSQTPSFTPFPIVQNFEQGNTMRPSCRGFDSTSPMSVMDFPRRNLYMGHEEIRNHRNIHVGAIDQSEHLQRFSSANEVSTHFHPRDPPSSNWELQDLAQHLLSDIHSPAHSDEQRVLAKVRSMGNVLDATKEHTPTDTSHSDQTTEDGETFVCPQPLNWLPALGSNENPCQLNVSSSYSSFDQMFNGYRGGGDLEDVINQRRPQVNHSSSFSSLDQMMEKFTNNGENE
ncbi:hypothetical protein GIB67_009211 [Kingdonia uniflora]|uniref:TRF2/HOY1 PH-like domain-containing protein n=1 Tax=Kingdonia uniflora TaxID=39325 RepID=A0A7J7N2P0_9MAGN|nr:hypothetical protein GIB67_009211 [Kingdonia uniflora]